MKKIDVSTPRFPNTFTMVDDCDYEALNKHKWYVHGIDGDTYVIRKIQEDGKQKSIMMHTEIMGKVNGKEIDHRNVNTLDNQRHNLRHCTKSENQKNKHAYINNTSGYKGVSWHKARSVWQVGIRDGGKRRHIGHFTCLIKAAKAHDAAARKHFGEFARTNFVLEPVQ